MNCGFCSKTFRNEPAFMVHLCVGKQRDQQRDEKHVRLGLSLFVKFFAYSYGTKKGQRTWSDFIKSRFYNDFVKVGRYISEINALNVPHFMDFLVRSSLPVNKWTSPAVYETYILDYAMSETPATGIKRNVELMQLWAVENGKNWTDFFTHISPALATIWISTGRISPWMIYVSSTSGALLSRLSNEQAVIVGKYLDPKIWGPKIKREQTEVDHFTAMFSEVGV